MLTFPRLNISLLETHHADSAENSFSQTLHMLDPSVEPELELAL